MLEISYTNYPTEPFWLLYIRFFAYNRPVWQFSGVYIMKFHVQQRQREGMQQQQWQQRRQRQPHKKRPPFECGMRAILFYGESGNQ
jgi:hypothetical protein